MIIKQYYQGMGEDTKEWSKGRLKLIEDSYQKFLQNIKGHLIQKYTKPDHIFMEAGCGSGEFVRAVQEKIGAKAIGVDFGEELITQLKIRYPDCQWNQADVRDLSAWADASIDVMTSFGVVEHIEVGPDQALREINRLIKPGGILVFSVPRISLLMLTGLLFHALRHRNFSLFHKEEEILSPNSSFRIFKCFNTTDGQFPFAQYVVNDRKIRSYFDRKDWTILERHSHAILPQRTEKFWRKILSDQAYHRIFVLERPKSWKEKLIMHLITGGSASMKLLVLQRKA